MFEQFVPLANTDEFDAFWEANKEEITFSRAEAFALASNQMLYVCGGASLLFRVGFVDEE